MFAYSRRMLSNEEGFLLGASILISALMLLAGVLALWASSTEIQVVRNDGDMTREFYNAEGGVIDVMANYDEGGTAWMTDAFLLAREAGFAEVTSEDGLGTPIAAVKVRAIEPVGTTLFGSGDPADNLPQLEHVGPPHEDSGYSPIYFEARRYGITSTSDSGSTQVQVGVWKAFNKF